MSAETVTDRPPYKAGIDAESGGTVEAAESRPTGTVRVTTYIEQGDAGLTLLVYLTPDEAREYAGSLRYAADRVEGKS